MTQEEIDRLRSLCAAATLGPWDWDEGDNAIYRLETMENIGFSPYAADAAFIAAAREAIPALLDEVEKAQKFEDKANQILNTQSEIIRNCIDAFRKADEEIYRMRGALKPFSDRAALYDCSDANDDVDWFGCRPIITIGDLRRAREAVGESE